MKILLINPLLSGERRYTKFASVGSYLPPYGLMSIAAVLEDKGHDVKIIDADKRGGMSESELIFKTKNFDPDIIGLTAYSIGRDQVIETAKYLKEAIRVPIVVGGPHVMVFPDDLIQYSCFDVLVKGEGEFTMLQLVKAFSQGAALENVKGLLLRKNGKIYDTQNRPFIEDLDILPFPAFHLVEDIEDYRPTPLMYKRLPILMLTTSRGCPYSCIFCNSIWGKRFRANSSEYIVDLIKYAVNKYGFGEIMFYEDTFTLRKERVFELCSLLKKRKIDVIWSCSANVNKLSKSLLQEMKSAGCWIISIGIETGNEEILRFIKKPTTLDKIRQVAKWADEIGIALRGFFIIGHLTDTRKTIRQTIDFAKSLPLHTVNFCILQLLPGSEARKIAYKYGNTNLKLELGTGHPGNTLSFVPKGLNSQFLRKTQVKAYAEFYLRPSQVWRLLRSIDSWEDIRKYWVLVRTFMELVMTT